MKDKELQKKLDTAIRNAEYQIEADIRYQRWVDEQFHGNPIVADMELLRWDGETTGNC